MEKKIIAAGGLVTNSNKELLMIFRRGFWDLPKGKLDPGETLEECAVREVREETGLQKIVLGKFLGITLHDYFDTHLGEQVTKESHWFEMKVREDQPLIPQTEEDITRICWVGRSEVSNYLEKSYPNISEIVNRFFLEKKEAQEGS